MLVFDVQRNSASQRIALSRGKRPAQRPIATPPVPFRFPTPHSSPISSSSSSAPAAAAPGSAAAGGGSPASMADSASTRRSVSSWNAARASATMSSHENECRPQRGNTRLVFVGVHNRVVLEAVAQRAVLHEAAGHVGGVACAATNVGSNVRTDTEIGRKGSFRCAPHGIAAQMGHTAARLACHAGARRVSTGATSWGARRPRFIFLESFVWARGGPHLPRVRLPHVLRQPRRVQRAPHARRAQRAAEGDAVGAGRGRRARALARPRRTQRLRRGTHAGGGEAGSGHAA